MTGIYVKVFDGPSGKLIAACDEDVLGQTFIEGRLKLEVTEGFYKGALKKLEEAIGLVEDADIANLTGPSIVDAVVKGGLADPNAIIYVDGIPHLQLLRT